MDTPEPWKESFGPNSVLRQRYRLESEIGRGGMGDGLLRSSCSRKESPRRTLASALSVKLGGGTGLATQRECLELLGCYGKGGVKKFAEIVAATVLCGELSLGTAVIAEEWVASHDKFGRNRP